MEQPEVYRCYQLMEMSGCLSLDEMFDKVKSARQLIGWYLYLDERDKRENERMEAMFGQ